MSFSEKLKDRIESTYQSNSLADVFYKPVLSEAKMYKRVSSYFSSEGLKLYSEGLQELFENNGFVQFIISTNISKDDFVEIQTGYTLRESLANVPDDIKASIFNAQSKKELGDLAVMIAQGRAEVKFALVPDAGGIFHDKFGLISSDEDTVYFTGSVNETQAGLQKNYESISVDVSWDPSSYVQSRMLDAEKRFEKLWTNTEKGVLVKDATELVYDEIAKYQDNSAIKVDEKNNVAKTDNQLENFDGIYFRMLNKGQVIREDYTSEKITNTDRKLSYDRSDLATFFEDDNSIIKPEVTYKDIEKIIAVTKKRATRLNKNVKVSDQVEMFLTRNKYSIKQYKILGQLLKSDTADFDEISGEKFNSFSKIVQSEVVRPLKPLHLKAAFYEYRMARAANFSVPGAGKTAMILGVFAYLNRESMKDSPDFVDKILVVSPINAFDSWKSEFSKVFGDKKILNSIDSQSCDDFDTNLNLKWRTSNLVMVNYESLQKYLPTLQRLIDTNTMLVFDEVHRIKNPDGQRAGAALQLVKIPRFKFVMTGTPIPNSYTDIYNFLHILYGNEYSSYFGWDVDNLKEPNVRQINEINEKIEPFFWRVNKEKLGVPDANEDIFEVANPSEDQLDLAESIYYNEKSSLARLVRLIQASTNPALLLKSISYSQMGFSDDGDVNEDEFNEKIQQPSKSIIRDAKSYDEFNLGAMRSPKFDAGIELIEKLVSEKKKVIVWGIFVDTMKKIKDTLENDGISTNLVYGETAVSERPKLIEQFKNGHVNVMISNPQTLGESISLHEHVHDAVYFEYNFNLTFMLQSRDRIHRLGLSPNQYTQYYYLETRGEDSTSDRPGYIDQLIYERLEEKEEVMHDAIDNDNLEIQYSHDEIEEAIKIIDDERNRITKNRVRDTNGYE